MKHQYTENIPEELVEEGILYISKKYNIAIHKCCCGCGNEVVTPISSSGWQLTENDGKISLTPSIGSFSLPCKSHYWIKNSEVHWAK